MTTASQPLRVPPAIESKLRRVRRRDRLARCLAGVLITAFALVAMLDVFLNRKGRDSTPMYDPVTLSMAYTDEYIQTEKMCIAVHLDDGVLRLEPQPNGEPNMDISISVRPQQFVDALVSRLLD